MSSAPNATATSAAHSPVPPITKWVGPVLFSWLVPGAGYFMLKRPIRGALTAISILVMFSLGLLMRGAMFEWLWSSQDMLTTVIYCGGYVANLCAGLPYFLATWLGYNQPDVAGHVHDYGTKFLAGAGLLNVLAMVDVYEIIAGKKD